jgi:hypothetical protein
MASAPIRYQLGDHLITTQNLALEEGYSATGTAFRRRPRSCSPRGR